METNKQNKQDTEYSLALKKWDGYIQKQHLKGDDLQDLEETLYFSKKNFIRYFSMIDAMVNRNSSYVTDYSKLSKKLSAIRKTIINAQFIDTAVKDGIKMQNLGIDFVTPDAAYMTKVDEVKEIFRQIQLDFVKRGINPDPTVVDDNKNNGGKKIA